MPRESRRDGYLRHGYVHNDERTRDELGMGFPTLRCGFHPIPGRVARLPAVTCDLNGF
jgi:hypothetical protein